MKKCLITFFIVVLFSSLFSNEGPYHYRIVEIETEERQYAPFTHVYIVLDNGSRWFTDFHNHYARYFDGWQEGDLVSLQHCFCGHYALTNLSHSQLLWHFTLDRSTQDVFPMVSSVEDNGYYLTLSDGSKWSIGYFNAGTASEWRVGSSVVVHPENSTLRGTTHSIYNMDDETYIYATFIAEYQQ
ncbi:MAG: hypothetical protein KDK76_07405 [Chlamydiia bacterium]|nr:hypothetical protein [Chlamydiia bacterium]